MRSSLLIEAEGWEGRYLQGFFNAAGLFHLEAADLELQKTGEIGEQMEAELKRLGFERGPDNFVQMIEDTLFESAAARTGRIGAEVFRLYGVSEKEQLRCGNLYSSARLENQDVLGAAYPPHVQNDGSQRRWNWALLVAAVESFHELEEAGIDEVVVSANARRIYADPRYVADGTEQDFQSAVASGRALGFLPRPGS